MRVSPLPDASRARLRIGLGAAVVLVLAALGAAVLVGLLAPQGVGEVIAPGAVGGTAEGAGIADGSADDAMADDTTADDAMADVIYVHILGEVLRPGLYALQDGDRAIDAVAAAGGLTPVADRAAINLARVIADGEQLLVPAVGAPPPPDAPAAGGTGGAGAGGLVNLNTADAAALDTLPRIGPATAASIIEWRTEHGPFAAIDDLLAVPGIGEKTVEGLHDLVTV